MNIYESHCKSVDLVAIDEAQFFEDLVEFYMNFVEVDKKSLIVAGLNGTSDRESFGDITRLIPYCDNVEFIKPFCVRCSESKKITPAIFSKRLCVDTNAICIGGGESYIPVCREHF